MTVRIERIVVRGGPTGSVRGALEQALIAEAWVQVDESRQLKRVQVSMPACSDRIGWSRALSAAILEATTK